jgi:hypothetical protein
MTGNEVTGSIKQGEPTPTETDLAFARTAASDVLTKGDKDSSQPAGPGLRIRRRPHLPGLPSELRQRQDRELAARFGLP